MTTIRRARTSDLYNLDLCNLDPLTENYDRGFYLEYLFHWPSLFNVVENEQGQIVGYIMGKLETTPPHARTATPLPWHGHITVLTIAPSYRRLGLATRLTASLERASDASSAYFVDLYVRQSNALAIEMYEKMGYRVYRRVRGYYAGGGGDGEEEEGEDAFDMRKPLSADKEKKFFRAEGGRDCVVEAWEVF